MVVFVLIFMFSFSVFAQKNKSYQLQIQPDTIQSVLGKNFRYEKTFSDSLQRKRVLNEILAELQKVGFLTASFDHLENDTSQNLLKAKLFLGLKYQWANLKSHQLSDDILIKSGYRERFFTNETFSISAYAKLVSKILKVAENSGYPFARIGLDSVKIQENKISANLKLDKFKRISIDSLQISGTNKISSQFLQNYLDIQIGSFYDESKIKAISQKIKNLKFVRESKPFKIYFYNNKAILYFFLKDVNVNQFNGIVGVFPNAQNSGKLRLTGDLQLSLQNSLKRGELLDFNWKSIQQGTQELKINLAYPYLFNMPFGSDLDFQLFYRDSIFLQIYSRIGLQYIYAADNYIKVFFEQRNFNVLNDNLIGIQNDSTNYADIVGNIYGLEFKIQRLNQIQNPTKGFLAKISLGLGNRKIESNINPGENNPNPSQTSTQYQFEWLVSKYFPWNKRFVTALDFQGKVLLNDQIFVNELYRFGGFKTLRGFEEEVLLAAQFGVLNIEQRILLDNNSYFFAFWNGAYYKNPTIIPSKEDTPFGFGAGLSFQTKSGIFSLIYALGKQKNNPIQFRSAKVHFGYKYYL